MVVPWFLVIPPPFGRGVTRWLVKKEDGEVGQHNMFRALSEFLIGHTALGEFEECYVYIVVTISHNTKTILV